ncbi:MAG: TonB-dependent receptor [Duncaniella sp.]|nr:TonB-dependent receptor [Duncaniella sp.]
MKNSAAFFSILLSGITAFAQTSVPVDSASIALSEVVVTGSNKSVNRDLLPYTVSVVSRNNLEATGQTQVLAAISGQVPSLFVSQRGIFGFGVSNGGSGHIKMRGVGGDRAGGVLMMVDGQPQFAGIYSHHIADFYSKETVERVEVLRGPGSVLYGSNAMAGVINVITRDARHHGVHTTLTSQYGSYNTWLSSITNTTRFGRFSSLVSLSYDRTDGNVKDFDFKQASGYAKIRYDISDNWSVKADYTLMNFRGNDPVYPRLNNPESTDIYHQNVTRGEASIAAANRYAATSGYIQAYYSYGNHYVDDPRHFHSLDDRFGILAYQNLTPWNGAAMTVGFDFNTYTGRIPMSGGSSHTPGSISTMSRKSVTEYSPYLTLAQELFNRSLILNGGLRMANSDKFDTQWVPQAGFVVTPVSGLTVKGSLSMGYRNPSFREMYLYRMANPDLSPERMMNYEVSIGKSFSRYFGIDVTAYYCKGDNMIQVVEMKNVNTGRFINKGIEISAHSRPLDNLTLTASYSYLHTSLDNLVGAPKNQYFLGVNWRVIKQLNISADIKGVGGLFVHESVKHQNYALLNCKIDYELCRYAAIFTRLENITGARYEINRGYEMPGFTAMGGIKLNF